jgi:Lrp/AsnC family leucine-responsive transcriptional regulator
MGYDDRMDSRDRRIIALLQANARLTYQEIGEGVGLSTAAAYQRVRKLEESGVITGYHARVAPEAVGSEQLALLRLEPAPGADLSRLLSAWEVGRGVEACYRTVGGAVMATVRLTRLPDLEPYVAAARAAGCAVRAELVSATVFERWTQPADAGDAG